MRDSISVSKYIKGLVNVRYDESVCYGVNRGSSAEVCICVSGEVKVSNV